jgi:hypothetical protein
MDLRVHYHPTRIEADVAVPLKALVTTEVLSEAGEVLKTWNAESLSSGNHTLKRPLEGMNNGTYAFRISTGSQSTNRRFQLTS